MDANNYETMGREPAKNTINSDHKLLYCSWHPFGKQKVRLNKYIISGSTNLPPVVTKKEVLCSRHIQLHLASHNISHIHTRTGLSSDFQVSKNLKKRLPPPLNQSVLPLLAHWKNVQVQADMAEWTSF